MALSTSTEGDPSTLFTRSELPFFHDEATKNAIVDLAQVETLVIYCGAGVTIDRTGLSWMRMATDLLRQELRDDRHTNHDRHATVPASDEEIALLAARRTPLELASILSELGRIHAGTTARALNVLVPRLHLLLYTNHGWQAGALVRNIVRLAVTYSTLGKRVVIVTTNYDDYIEQEFLAYCNELRDERRAAGEPEPDLPGLEIRMNGNRRPINKRKPSRPGLPDLEIIYLHGRVSSNGRASGKLVLSESDYHASHEEAAATLAALFGAKGAGVLVLGSSTSDPPLLTALAATAKQPHRYALIPAEATEMVDARPDLFATAKRHLAHRGHHFGVEFLIPDFYFQIAQFCQEVLTSRVLKPGPTSYLDDAVGVRYGMRLVAWWERWQAVDENRGIDETSRMLIEGLDAIRREVTGIGEKLKIELWVRQNPRTRRDLTLCASTAGPLTDRSILRSEHLGLGSSNASVRAFVEGQPQYVAQADLTSTRGRPISSSRWRAFLSVPIRVNYSQKNEPVGLPVGAITLATMRDLMDSAIPYRDSARMESLVGLLRTLGQRLLDA